MTRSYRGWFSRRGGSLRRRRFRAAALARLARSFTWASALSAQTNWVESTASPAITTSSPGPGMNKSTIPSPSRANPMVATVICTELRKTNLSKSRNLVTGSC